MKMKITNVVLLGGDTRKTKRFKKLLRNSNLPVVQHITKDSSSISIKPHVNFGIILIDQISHPFYYKTKDALNAKHIPFIESEHKWSQMVLRLEERGFEMPKVEEKIKFAIPNKQITNKEDLVKYLTTQMKSIEGKVSIKDFTSFLMDNHIINEPIDRSAFMKALHNAGKIRKRGKDNKKPINEIPKPTVEKIKTEVKISSELKEHMKNLIHFMKKERIEEMSIIIDKNEPIIEIKQTVVTSSLIEI